MLLILSNLSDFTVDYVICDLLEKGIEYFRLNSEEIGTAEYDLRYEKDVCNIEIDVAKKKLQLKDVKSIWYRRKPTPEVPSSISEKDRNFAFNELSHIIDGILPQKSVRWVDHPSSVRLAERKLQQLRVAVDFGMRIPRTIISTNPHSLIEFAKKELKGVICKPIFRGLNIVGSQAESAYTRLVSDDELESILENPTFPTLLQEFVPKGSDLRITVVGNHFWGVEITTKIHAVDWRMPEVSPEYRIFEVPDDLKKQCKAILNFFGLTYGAFDFAVSPDGQVYFLEVNAVGEWAWLDRELNLGIKNVIVDHLYTGK